MSGGRSPRRLALVFNPRSAAGRTEGREEDLKRLVDRHFSDWWLLKTEGAGHGRQLAAEALGQGAEMVVAVGGDGTANEVVNGLFDRGTPRRADVIFSVIPAGTGSDLVKSVGMPRDPEQALRILATTSPRPTDVIHLEMIGHDGVPTEGIGLNVTGFGMNGEVVYHANRSSKRWGGTVTFALATLKAMRTWRPQRVRMEWVDAQGRAGAWEGRLTSAFLANGHFCGGGMWVGRGGAMDDGLVELKVIPDLPRRTLVTQGRRLFDGTLDHVKSVSSAEISSLRAESLDGLPIGLDVDGEQLGVLPVNMRVLRKALLVTGEWPYAPKGAAEPGRD